MKLQPILRSNTGSREAAISINKSGCVSISLTAVKELRLADVQSVSVLHDKDNPKDFFIQFFNVAGGNFTARHYQGRLQFNCADIYRAMKNAFNLRSEHTLIFKIGILTDLGDIKAHPLLINLSELS